MTRTEAISGSVLVVAGGGRTDVLLQQAPVERAGLSIERAADPDDAIARVGRGDAPDVVLLAEGLADPVRVAQRLHSLDRDGAVLVLTEPDAQEELLHALAVAPFLDGDVAAVAGSDATELATQLTAAAARTRSRREAAPRDAERRETPPPLSAQYLGTLLDSVPLGLVTLDADRQVIGWNKRAGDMLGIAEVEALGRRFTDLFASQQPERLDRLIAALGSTGIGDYGQTFWHEGRAFDLSGARFAIRSGEGGTLLILQDVTGRELAERELRLQKALSDAQADSSQVGIVVMALDGELIRANRRFAEMWGVSSEEMRDDRAAARRRLLDQVEDPEGFVPAVDAFAASGGDYRDEIELKDGRVIERYATHVRDEAGEVVGQIWFHTDITAHRREEDALRFLADATNLLSSSLDYEITLGHVAELAVPRLADWCRVETDAAAPLVAGVIRSGEPAFLYEIGDEQLAAIAGGDEDLTRLRELAPREAMLVPIKVRERVFGAIVCIRGSAGKAYADEDVKVAEELARRAAIAIDNSRVHAELRATARTLQESLLPPHLPAARGLELAARFRPAGAGMQVGGDFYDIFETGPDRWGIAVGDVCGKGADAAALTALARYTVRTAAMYETESAGVLRVLNEALLRQRADYRFTTLTFCIVDLSGERPVVQGASGGHPRPLLLRPDGRVERVGGTGPLMGVMADAAFADAPVELESGDALVFYTDGLTDALAPAQMLSEDDLCEALAGCNGLSAGEISLRLEQVALGGDPRRVPRDDIALVVAKLV